jgi:hypothetical protein
VNRSTRNLVVILLAIACSLVLATVCFFLEWKGERPLISYMLWSYFPAGALAAGLVAASGVFVGARMLRTRPTRMLLVAILAISAGMVYLMDSVEYGLQTDARRLVTDVPSAGQFVQVALLQSPLREAFSGYSPGDGESPRSSASASPMVQVSSANNASVEGIGAGVQGLMASSNALSADNMSSAFSGAGQRVAGLKSFGAGVLSHSGWLVMAASQWVGFMLAGLLVYSYLRSLSYCDGCALFLSRKGEQTRYYESMREIQESVEDFLTRVKGRQYRQSIQGHFEEGSAERTDSSAFSSTVEISICSGCPKHQLKFSAQRKEGRSWKEIGMLGHTAFCLEPVDVGGGYRFR